MALCSHPEQFYAATLHKAMQSYCTVLCSVAAYQLLFIREDFLLHCRTNRLRLRALCRYKWFWRRYVGFSVIPQIRN